MHRLNFLCSLAILVIGGASAAAAEAPAAPTGLKVKALGVNAFQLTWTDNSTDEVGWEIRVALGGNPPQRFTLLPVPNATSYLLIINELPGKELDFQVAAYNGVAGQEKISKSSATVSADTFSSTTFGAPTKLAVIALDDGRFQLSWKDNSTSEIGYQIQFREAASKTWLAPIGLNPGVKFKQIISGFPPGARYSFRVRAVKGNPLKGTAYSKVVSVSTQEFLAPSELVVTPQGEGEFVFRWKDRSSIESGFELERKIGDGEFGPLGTINANDTFTIPVPGFAMDTDHQFRLRGFRETASGRVYSPFSNIAAVRSTPMATPRNFGGSIINNASVLLTWNDVSAFENGYEIRYREVGSTDFTTRPFYSQQETASVTDLLPNTLYEFQIRNFSFFLTSKSAFTNLVQLRTKDRLVGEPSPPIVVGSQFLYQIQTSKGSPLSGLSVTGLPAGLRFNSTLGTIEGTLTTAGTYTITVTGNYADGSSNVRDLVLKSVGVAPTATQTFAGVSVPITTTKTVSLAGKFADPDTLSAVRMATGLGTFDIILFATSTPFTNDNFLNYIDAGAYDNSFFHRSPAGFVVQGGGYKHTAAAGFSGVVTTAPVANEPGLSNVRGTVAMAKLGGLPDSATSQWFVNVADNSANLDAQNGGFTVFGRVPAAGMTVVDAINALPRGTYMIPIGAGNATLDNLPVNTTPPAPAGLDPAQLVKISSVTAAPILTYSVLSSNAAIATASLSGTDITLTGVASGSTTIAVTATDLDGNTTSQNIAVTVP